MNSNAHSRDNIARARKAKLIGFALTTAVAGISVSGCASPAPPAAHSANLAEAALAKGKHQTAVQHAEAAVLAEPRNAAYRATLGSAYLDSGRFASAATAFSDAIALGDNSSRTALSLALAYAADGNGQEALHVLDSSEDKIAPSDLGLAYSLAGDPTRGIDVLTMTLRGGENTAKVRQNLAYSFALAGRWREARLMAGEDVPADKLGDRMAEWASLVQPEAFRQRIAGLLSVPAQADDPGQPVQLALSNFPSTDQLAAEAQSNVAPAPVALAANTASAQTRDAGYELPPVGDPVDASVAAAPVTAQPVAARPRAFENAFADSVATSDTPHFTRAAAAPAKLTGAKPAKPRLAAATASGTHLVQLGSFSSADGANRAWSIYLKRYPSLHNHQMVITKALVNGKNFWRVAAGGFYADSSRAMCSRVKSSGCFAYASTRQLPGVVKAEQHFASR